MPPLPRQNLPPKHRYDAVPVTPELPPELPVKAKKNPLKSPLKAIRNAIAKSTKSLRRQASFMEPSESKKQRHALRRQHSMMERGSGQMFYSPQHHPSQSQDYYEYQQQQYFNYYQTQRQQFYSNDDRYAYYERHERYYPSNGLHEEEPLYGNYGPPQRQMDESIYANRALIELERPIQKPGGRIVRRHSMNERNQVPPAFATMTRRRPKYDEDLDDKFAHLAVDEPIYQSQRGSYMYQEQAKHHLDPLLLHDTKRRHFFERPIEDSEKLLQARKDISSPPGSSASTPTSVSSPSKERNLRDSRRQLKEQIYQSRLDAMQSMAEPIYVSKSSSGTSTNTGGNLRSQPIYESKRESEEYNENSKDTSGEVDTSNENNETGEKSLLEVIEETIMKNKSQDHLNETALSDDVANGGGEIKNQFEIPFADEETMTDSTLQQTAIENMEIVKQPSRAPDHIANIIRRNAPPPPPIRSPTTAKTGDAIYESHTSIDTQFTSPNAQSTPYSSELTLKEQRAAARARFLAAPPLRQPITTKGCFDENGGVLEDKTWNVSLIIPPNALPAGTRQEIYFTVTDPRLSESVGGPPLDMENGWFEKKMFYVLHNFFRKSLMIYTYFILECL